MRPQITALVCQVELVENLQHITVIYPKLANTSQSFSRQHSLKTPEEANCRDVFGNKRMRPYTKEGSEHGVMFQKSYK